MIHAVGPDLLRGKHQTPIREEQTSGTGPGPFCVGFELLTTGSRDSGLENA
jgi:hypothetical protein